jgi:hypothetical protein
MTDPLKLMWRKPSTPLKLLVRQPAGILTLKWRFPDLTMIPASNIVDSSVGYNKFADVDGGVI